MKIDVDFTRIFVDDKLIEVLNFNNMIPVNDSLIHQLSVKPEKGDTGPEKAYKILCAKELDWVQKNQDAIIKKANKLYQMIKSGTANHGSKQRCLDFGVNRDGSFCHKVNVKAYSRTYGDMYFHG